MEITHRESSHSLETLPVQKYTLFKSGSDIEYHYPESQDSERKSYPVQRYKPTQAKQGRLVSRAGDLRVTEQTNPISEVSVFLTNPEKSTLA